MTAGREPWRVRSAPGGNHPGCIEVATFRNDGIYSDGRHPDQVSFSRDPREDVQRRDFTINGLLLDPLDGGKVLDLSAEEKTCGQALSAQSAMPRAVSRKISCGCCARFVLRHASDMRLSRELLPRCTRWREKFARSAKSAFATS